MIYAYLKDSEIQGGEWESTFVDLFSLATDTITSEKCMAISESKRSFREMEKLVVDIQPEDILIVKSFYSFGLTLNDVIRILNMLVRRRIRVIIESIPPTFDMGVDQPMNNQIIRTIILFLKEKNQVTQIPERRSAAGRKSLPLPDHWDDMYNDWEDGKLSSADFLKKSGLKRATFYNLMSEYKSIRRAVEEYEDSQSSGA